MARTVLLPMLLAVLSSLLVLSPLPCSCASTAAVIFRGVAPQDKALYSGKTVTCRDGSKTIPIAKVNDDFCDCADGTDEPGTSACPTSKFYCRNRGHEPTLLFSSRVNDGICDCCDGSDEWDGWVRCNATCAEAGAEARKELAALVHKYSEGAKLREAVVTGAAEKRKQWEEEKAKLEAEKAELEQKEHALKDAGGGSAGGDGGSSSSSLRDVTLSAHGGQNKDISSSSTSSSSSSSGGSAGGSSSSGSKTWQYLWVLLQVGGVWVVLLAVSLACYCMQQQRRVGSSRRRGRSSRRNDGSTLPLHF